MRDTIVAAMDKPNADVIQGTLNMLILKTLSLEPMHRVWRIARARRDNNL